jgi:diguanylate cyclase (GGDEF)-like protein
MDLKRLSGLLKLASEEADLEPMLGYLLDTLLEECHGARARAVVIDRGATKFDVTRSRKADHDPGEFTKTSTWYLNSVTVTGQHVARGAVLCLPMDTHGRVVGAIYLEGNRPFEESEIEVARAVTAHTGTTLSTILFQAHSGRDPLTGLHTHAHFEKLLESEANRARRHGRRFGLLLVDVDGIRDIVAQGKYVEGRVLAEMATILSSSLRNYDRMARVRLPTSTEAEAFGILVCDAGRTELQATAERILARIRSHEFKVGEQLLRLTVSIGGAVFPDDAALPDLRQRGAEALMRARESGQNRYLSAGPAVVTPGDRGGAIDPLIHPKHGRSVVDMVSRVLREGGGVDAMLRQALDLMAKAVQAERGIIMLLKEGARQRAVLNMPEGAGELNGNERLTDLLRQAIASAQPVREESGGSAVPGQRGAATCLVVPIISDGRVLGAVYLESKSDRRFTQEEEELLVTFAGVVARPLEQGAELRQGAEEVSRLQDIVRTGLSELAQRYQYAGVVGRSEAMRPTLAIIEQVAQSPFPAVIVGEAGTGKELIAKTIHFNGPRRGKPFLAVDCAAMAEVALEAQLFGYAKGSVTDESRLGHFEATRGGTLFLDELEGMGEGMQKKLLRVLEEGRYFPIGSRESLKVDARILAATHDEIQDLVEEGRVRKDLYQHLSTFVVRVPPLRERSEDIPLLVEHVLDEVARETGRPRTRVTREALGLLVRYPWPGNVRELRNEVRKLTVIGGAEILAEELPAHIRDSTGSLGRDQEKLERTTDIDRRRVLDALDRHDWNLSRAAEDLGLTRRVLKLKLKQSGARRSDD